MVVCLRYLRVRLPPLELMVVCIYSLWLESHWCLGVVLVGGCLLWLLGFGLCSVWVCLLVYCWLVWFLLWVW